jgi:GntR family transcriptional regulator
MTSDAGDSDRPKYLQIADTLRSAIVAGTLAPGVQLPGNRALMGEHGVSLMTVRRALDLLTAEGLIESRPGSGVFVRQFRRIRRRSVARLSAERWGTGQPIWEADSDGRALLVDRVEVQEAAPPESVGVLLAAETVIARSRRFVLDGKPVLLACSYLPAELVSGSAITDSNPGPGGIYARLAELGHGPTRFREDVMSRMPTQAEAQDLEMPAGTPVVLVTRIAYEANGRTVEVNEMVLDASAYVLEYDFDA